MNCHRTTVTAGPITGTAADVAARAQTRDQQG